MGATFADIRTRAKRVLFPPSASDAEAASFARYAAERSVLLCRALLLFVLATSLVWWPFDYVLHRDNPTVVTAIAAWRLAIVGTGLPALWFFFRARAFAERHFVAILAALLMLDTGLLAWSFSPLGGLTTPWFYTTIPTPLTTLAVLVPLGRRALMVLAIVIASALGSFLPHPENLDHPMLGSAIVMLIYLGAVALVAGHVIFLLVRKNFSQREDLARRALDLEALDRAKSRFFANVSHELRTPLTLILGGLRQWRERAPNADDTRMAGIALRSGSRLLLLVNELLDLARYEAGHGAPRKQPCDVAALVHEVAAAFGVAPGIEVSASEGPVWAYVDVEQVRRVLYNLVANAQKHTPAAGRRIVLECDRDADTVVLRVRDNGPGIPAIARERIFEPFTRLDQSPSGVGWGVGLSLVREVVSAHGGRVHVEEAQPHGAVFVVRLPLGAIDPAELAKEPSAREADAADNDAWVALVRASAPETNAEALQSAAVSARALAGGARVMVVEDHDELREYVAKTLAPEWRVETHASALSALSQIRKSPPDLVLTDLMMPGMTGQELLTEIRADAALADLPVIVLTAQAAVAARTEALRAGATDYLLKPFDELELTLRVRNALSVHTHARALRVDNVTLARDNTSLEERLAAQLDDVRRLADHLDASREEERRRIARELHDELGQTLTAMRLDADRCEANVPVDPERALRALTHVSKGIDELLTHVRRIVADMRPQVLDDLGLNAAAAWLCNAANGRGGPEIAVDLEEGCADSLSPEAQSALYRILQEALTNVQRHARATRAVVRLCRDADDVLLEVSDDGVGMPRGTQGEGRGGFGLLGMRERARGIGGTFRIVCREPGTRVEVRVPSARAKAKEVRP